MSEKPRAIAIEQRCIVVSIVGTLPHGDIGDRLQELLEKISMGIVEVFPDFVPAYPAFSIAVSQLGIAPQSEETTE
jgi:hypothetical protein